MIPHKFLYGAFRPVAIVISVCAVTSISNAQSTGEEPPAITVTPVLPESAPIDEQKLNQFAEAFLAIEEINAQTEQELDEVETTAEGVVAKAEERVIQAVKRSGLQLDEFHRIAGRTAVDDSLRARLAKKVEERRRI